VYCVRLRNGHRVWAVDLGDRLSLPLASGRIREPGDAARSANVSSLDFVLGVPDGGGSLVALDAYNGNRLAAYDAGAQEMIVTAPLLLADGRVAVGRTGYSGGGAALVVLRIETVPEDAKSGPN
jgi:energy-converting hydrogenase Eha subunit B